MGCSVAPVPFALPLNAVVHGHEAASMSFWVYWLRAGSASQNSPYPARSTAFGLSCHATPARGPMLSYTGLGMNGLLPMNLMWSLNGIDAKPLAGKHGFCCVVLQSGIESAPISH